MAFRAENATGGLQLQNAIIFFYEKSNFKDFRISFRSQELFFFHKLRFVGQFPWRWRQYVNPPKLIKHLLMTKFLCIKEVQMSSMCTKKVYRASGKAEGEAFIKGEICCLHSHGSNSNSM